nr:hypothetical protein [Tanacetum cinerariifolium]
MVAEYKLLKKKIIDLQQLLPEPAERKQQLSAERICSSRLDDPAGLQVNTSGRRNNDSSVDTKVRAAWLTRQEGRMDPQVVPCI